MDPSLESSVLQDPQSLDTSPQGTSYQISSEIVVTVPSNAVDGYILPPLKEGESVVVNIVHSNDDAVQLVDNSKEAETFQGRVRKRKPQTWKQNQRKLLRNTGESYTTRKGKVVPKRNVMPIFVHNCKKECNLVTDGKRENIFSNFWKMGNFELQNSFICSSIKEIHKFRSRPRKERSGDSASQSNAHQKQLSRSYTLRLGETSWVVCKSFFLRTLSISNGRIHRALQLPKHRPDGMGYSDMRGKQKNSRTRTVKESDKKFVHEHIRSVPTYISHYARAHISERKRYYSPGVTISKLYQPYKEKSLNA